MRLLHLTNSDYLRPLLNRLHDAGAPVNKYLRNAKLDQYRLDAPGTFVPLYKFQLLLKTVAQKEAVKDLAAIFSADYKLEALGDWGTGIANCEDILSACKAAQAHAPQFQTNQRIRMEIRGHKCSLHNAYFDLDNRYSGFFEVVSLFGMFDGFRLGCGANWAPLEVHTTLDSLDDYAAFLPMERCAVKYRQPEFGIVFPTADLAKRIRTADPQLTQNLGNLGPEALLMSERIRRLLDATSTGPIPNLENIADIADVSPRTLQRILIEEGTTYFDVVDDWRLKRSLDLLSHPSVNITDVSELLHYANTANYGRAFKRWTGVSPTAYRNNLV